MGHEITRTDRLLLHRQRAWHGLGTIVEQAPTPTEALTLAGLDWHVDQWPLVAVNEGGARMGVETHVANVRRDTGEQLGIVGQGYRPIQNAEMADFAESLAKEGDVVRLETAGSIRGGKKVWLLLKGESFSVRSDDEVRPYILISNGHDGTAALRCTPTTVRVVCSNTLHMVIPERERKSLARGGNAYVVQHSGDIRKKVDEARAALRLYEHALTETHGLANTLAAKDVSRQQIQDFWLDVYQRDWGAVPTNPTDASEQRRRERATAAMASMGRLFDERREVAGATAWNAANAYTEWLQHERKLQTKDPHKAAEQRLQENLFGTSVQRSQKAMMLAATI